MSGDIAFLLIRSFGGFWKFRSRLLELRRDGLACNVMKVVYYAYQQRYGAFIGHSAKFASIPCLPHYLNGIFVAGNASIGRNCIVFQQVTIGANALPDSKGVGSPIIGDNVYIGAGAKIIGAVRIGSNCRVGANCVVTDDVPNNAIVVLPRPNVMIRDEPIESRYYRWSPGGPIYYDDGKWVKETDPEKVERLRGAL